MQRTCRPSVNRGSQIDPTPCTRARAMPCASHKRHDCRADILVGPQPRDQPVAATTPGRREQREVGLRISQRLEPGVGRSDPAHLHILGQDRVERQQMPHRSAERAAPLAVAMQERRPVAPADRRGGRPDPHHSVRRMGLAVERRVLAVGRERRQHEPHRIASHAVEPDDPAPEAMSGEQRRHLRHHSPPRREPPGERPQPRARRLLPVGRGGTGMLEPRQHKAHADCLSTAARPSRSSSSRTSFLVILP